MRRAALLIVAAAAAVGAGPARGDEPAAGHEVDALIARARASRWSGHPLAARALAARAVALEPAQPAASEELAWADLDLDLTRDAGAALAAAGTSASAQVRARLAELRMPRLAITSAASDDSNDIARLTARAVLELTTTWDLHVRAGGGLLHLQQAATTLDYRVAGVALALPFSHVRFDGEAGVVQRTGAVQPDAGVAVALRPVDGVRLTLGVRHRPFIEEAPPLTTDERAYYSAGAGGAEDLGQVADLAADEATLAAQLAPLPASYLYLDARALRASDGDRGYAVAAGAGVDLVGLVARPAPVSVYARWDAYLTGFAQPRAAYFSPSSFDAQAVGGEVQWRAARGLTVAGNGGYAFSFATAVSSGWFAGGGLDLALGPATLAARAQRRDDLYYRSVRAWLALEVRL